MFLLAFMFASAVSGRSKKREMPNDDEIEEKSEILCKGCQYFISFVKDCVSEKVINDAYNYIMDKCSKSKRLKKICSHIDYDIFNQMISDVALGVESKKYCELFKIC